MVDSILPRMQIHWCFVTSRKIFKTRYIRDVIQNKYVFCINEAYTTQTCSICGKLNKPYASEIYNCSNCNINISRDVNAAKNILMKGLIKI